MNKANRDIKDYAYNKSVFMWQIAERYGLHESNFSRLLRHPLSDKKREKIIAIINEIAESRQEHETEKANCDVREYAKSKGVKQWQVADKLGMSLSTFYERARHELTPSDKAKLFMIVNQIHKEMEEE